MMKYISNKVTKALGLIALTGLSGLMDAQTMNWSPAGPIYNAGRARNILVDMNDPSGSTIYCGSSSSGIFKTVDGGVNWAPLDDQGSIKNISYMAQGQNGIIYAATGEGFLRPGQKLKAQRGTGLYKLSGTTLVSVKDSNTVGAVINRIACSPVSANVIAVASNKGILISNDGGASFAAAPSVTPGTNGNFGMDVKFDNLGNLYCSIGNERGVLNNVNFSAVNSRVYRSDDPSLANFTVITPTSSILSDSNYGRIELAVAPSNNQIIYASCARKSNNSPNGASLQGLFVSYDRGSTWGLIVQGSPQLDPLSNGGTISSGDYAHIITVNPSNANQLFYGGYAFYIYQRTGGTDGSPVGNWVPVGSHLAPNTPFYLHENIHDIKIVNAGTSTKFYFVTDAGIYRSSDLANSSGVIPPSFQPFYKGLVTGQFNSVSIERYPLTQQSASTMVPVPGTQIIPFSGFIGGTGGNGLNYFSGTGQVVSQETNYLTGEVYNAELSKILPGAALLSTANGNLYRSTNVKTSDPTLVNYNLYTGALSKVSPAPIPVVVGDVTAGTPFKLWENYKNTVTGPDAVVFYNDTLRGQASMVGLATLTTQTTFTFQTARPNRTAQIDSIVIRTGTVSLPISGSAANVSTAFSGSDKQDISIKISNNFTPTNTISIPPITITGTAAAAGGVTLNPVTNLDDITITFSTAPFINKTTPSYPIGATGANITVPDPAAYYRVFATVFYKYKTGDTISIADNNISTINTTFKTVLTQSLNWAYGKTAQAYTLSATTPTAVTNPTYVLNPGNVTQSSPVFTVNPILTTTYNINTYGTYSVSGTPVVYTLAATTDPNVTGSTYTYVLNPGNVTLTAASNSTATVVFSVSPTANTSYTIIQSGSGTLTSTTFSTVNTSTYVLNPGNVSQSSPNFTVQVTAPTTYTIDGLSSNTAIGANTTKTVLLAAQTTSVFGSSIVPFAKNNPTIKVQTKLSARLAMIFNSSGVTNNNWAVVVSKAPLSLNDPLNFVRLSQSGCLTTKADGSPDSVQTITIPGRPILLEWSKSGTELYYATDDKKLYRVSYINQIMDFSPSSYSGKLSTDIFQYSSAGVGGVSSSTPNINSPYRTTLLGTFPNQITSISVSSDDASLLLTLDGGNLASYSSNNIKTANSTNINFQPKLGSGMTNVKTYCSLIENVDKKKVFIGTDNGIFYTSDITTASPTWANVNNNQLPNVQIFDIKQQTLNSGESYNSGQIYAATNGRGVWVNNAFNTPAYVGIDEIERKKTEKNISVFPNPTNGDVFIVFNSVQGENAIVNVMDINGRVVKTETLGKLDSGEVNYTMETASLSSGIYIVSINSSEGIKRVTKLIVTK